MTDSTRFTDEQLDRMVGELKHFGGVTADPAFGECAIMSQAAEAIRQLRSRVSLLEGERDEMQADVQQLLEATNGTMREFLALRSQLDEARQTIKRLAMHTRAAHSTFGRGDDFKTSQHIGSALKELRRFDAALDGHHGEPK
jgi:uncharacterized coiled-coil DUF342 family protein